MQIDIEAARLRQREQPVEPACQNGGILFFSETERESSPDSAIMSTSAAFSAAS
jgi:hypothetical protein